MSEKKYKCEICCDGEDVVEGLACGECGTAGKDQMPPIPSKTKPGSLHSDGSAATACSNCKAEMPKAPKATGSGPINAAKMTITAYRCQYCGHWNDLKRRKAWRQNDQAQARRTGGVDCK